MALVGYTNAGKSTLLNAMADADVYVADMLFATLDPTSRQVRLPGGRDVVMTDTVGFINKLPHDLVDAFRATLEEVIRADLLVEVVDASDTDFLGQQAAVQSVLDELGADQQRVVEVHFAERAVQEGHGAHPAGQIQPGLRGLAFGEGGTAEHREVKLGVRRAGGSQGETATENDHRARFQRLPPPEPLCAVGRGDCQPS